VSGDKLDTIEANVANCRDYVALGVDELLVANEYAAKARSKQTKLLGAGVVVRVRRPSHDLLKLSDDSPSDGHSCTYGYCRRSAINSAGTTTSRHIACAISHAVSGRRSSSDRAPPSPPLPLAVGVQGLIGSGAVSAVAANPLLGLIGSGAAALGAGGSVAASRAVDGSKSVRDGMPPCPSPSPSSPRGCRVCVPFIVS
jgi:hypothetical protein